jgi:Ca2+-transporting ATPase
MWRMAKRNALIRRLSAVETLGAATLILTDKTGTLTENRMRAARVLLSDGDAALERDGARGRIGAGDAGAAAAFETPLATALAIGMLCNGAEPEESAAQGSGDPMERALLDAGRAAGLDPAALRAALPRQAEHAFDPLKKMMATVHREGGLALYAVKGAPEAVLEACVDVLTPEGAAPLDAARRALWAERVGASARQGLRLLAAAFKRCERETEDPYAGLTLAGILCLVDPLRPDVPAALEACRAAGVRVVMVTGDHADTAAAIAREAGLGDGGRCDGGLRVIEGRELAGLDLDHADRATRERLARADVFARVSPETKLQLVDLFQAEGDIVAMTGDGVNDAPALQTADIGIAMGRRGTEVAREAADMVLGDDAFGTIVAAMRHGRIIFGNIRNFVVYLMSCNLSEVLIVTIAVGLGGPIPILPLQILFLNLVTDVFPAFALGFGRGSGDVMRAPPRDPDEPILDRARWLLIALLGGAITAATLGAFYAAQSVLELPTGEAMTVAFVTLAMAQLWNVFNMRAPRSGLFVNEVTVNALVWGAIALCLGLVALALWTPGLSAILRLPDPGAQGLALAAAASLAPLALGQIMVGIGPFRRPSADHRIRPARSPR